MRKKTKNRQGAFGLQVLLLQFLLLVGANGAYAQGDCFVYKEGSGNTVITDLTAKGMAASSLTIPGTVYTDRGHHDFDSFPLGSVPHKDNTHV